MTLSLIGALAKDLLVAVRRDESFFELSAAKRRDVVTSVLGDAYPEALVRYATQVSAQQFMADIQALLPALTQSHGVPGHLANTDAQQLRATGYTFDIPSVKASSKKAESKLDVQHVALSEEFYSDVRALLASYAQEQQEKTPNAFIEAVLDACSQDIAQAIDTQAPPTGATEYARLLQRVMNTYEETELTRGIQAMIATQRAIPSVVVQTPLALEPQERAQMREDLLKRVPGSFPLFEVEASLVGGVRVFIGGQLQDESLFTRVAALLRRIRT